MNKHLATCMSSQNYIRAALFIVTFSVFIATAQDSQAMPDQKPADITQSQPEEKQITLIEKTDVYPPAPLIPVDVALLRPPSDFTYKLSGKLKPEFFWGNNISLLNDFNDDRIIYMRHTLDLTADASYGKLTYGEDIVSLRSTLRNRGIWGNPDSIMRTNNREIRVVESILGEHNHSIPRYLMWIRELWLKVALDELLHLGFYNNHTLTLGAFSFVLGRGIALGDAYAVGPENLGWYSDSAVDQYAFGANFSGDITQDKLSYDIYLAILENNSSSLSDTGKKIQGQEYGRRWTPARGFGKINYLIAGRLFWNVLNSKRPDTLTVEPYVLFNDAREQRVEFLGDASGKMGTIGVALEYVSEEYEYGFDTAFNLGVQDVRGWDRNSVRIENRQGDLIEVNTHVLDAIPSGQKIVFAKGDAQKIIENSFQDQAENGKKIGEVTQAFLGQPPATISLYNACNRFRDPYTNILKGKMFVFDIGKWIYKKDLFTAATAGIASGDDNPNNETLDGDYKGFIGLQELYSGKRVQSAFIMSGSSKIRRPLSQPTSVQAPTRFATEASGFTNLIFVGSTLKWEPRERKTKFMLQPNALAYWQPYPTKKFDAFAADKTKRELCENARSYLGLELNLFANYYPIPNFKCFFIGALFIPGGHFKDIKGKPITADQEKELDNLDVTGISGDFIPNIGADIAVVLNSGIEYKF